MKIAVLKENKYEYRVCLVPSDIAVLVKNHHEIYVTKDAGVNAGFSDHDFLEVGAKIVKTNRIAIDSADLILKISKPLPNELKCFNANKLLMSIFNFANNPNILAKILKMKIASIAIEAVQENDVYELIIPNEQIKGRFGVLLGTYHLSKLSKFGLGKTFTSLEHNHNKAQFTIINASYAGLEAAKTVLGLGGNLSILENDEHLAKQIKEDHHLQTLAKLNKSTFEVVKADFTDLSKIVAVTDVLINTNSVPGSLTAKRITQKMVTSMKVGSVIVDLAIDQGVAGDTEKKPTSFEKPFFITEGVKHFAIENIPSLFSNSISEATSNILTEKFLNDLKGDQILDVIKQHKALFNAITTYDGFLTNKVVADALHLEYKDIKTLIK
ncbi:MAG: hypothetical protein LBP70_02150 [Mycoplasmataceae bacterium]|jgi:alanine dehydrogenase|nr:hypothetical protein [Mycoplasmataceae bacterium]